MNLDDDPESTEAERLPPPLQPQVINHGSTAAGTMCRSLSDFLSNITETTCTNSLLTPTPTAAPCKFPDTTISATSATDSSSKPATADENVKSSIEPDVEKAAAKNPSTASEMPTVSVTAEDVASGCLADDALEESSVSHADDSVSVSSLLLDGTVTSGVDISLLDDPFIALGAGEKDSLLEEPDRDASWTTDNSVCETAPMTSSPGDQAGRSAVGSEVTSDLVGVSNLSETLDSQADIEHTAQ